MDDLINNDEDNTTEVTPNPNKQVQQNKPEETTQNNGLYDEYGLLNMYTDNFGEAKINVQNIENNLNNVTKNGKFIRTEELYKYNKFTPDNYKVSNATSTYYNKFKYNPTKSIGDLLIGTLSEDGLNDSVLLGATLAFKDRGLKLKSDFKRDKNNKYRFSIVNHKGKEIAKYDLPEKLARRASKYMEYTNSVNNIINKKYKKKNEPKRNTEYDSQYASFGTFDGEALSGYYEDNLIDEKEEDTFDYVKDNVNQYNNDSYNLWRRDKENIAVINSIPNIEENYDLTAKSNNTKAVEFLIRDITDIKGDGNVTYDENERLNFNSKAFKIDPHTWLNGDMEQRKNTFINAFNNLVSKGMDNTLRKVALADYAKENSLDFYIEKGPFNLIKYVKRSENIIFDEPDHLYLDKDDFDRSTNYVYTAHRTKNDTIKPTIDSLINLPNGKDLLARYEKLKDNFDQLGNLEYVQDTKGGHFVLGKEATALFNDIIKATGATVNNYRGVTLEDLFSVGHKNEFNTKKENKEILDYVWGQTDEVNERKLTEQQQEDEIRTRDVLDPENKNLYAKGISSLIDIGLAIEGTQPANKGDENTKPSMSVDQRTQWAINNGFIMNPDRWAEAANTSQFNNMSSNATEAQRKRLASNYIASGYFNAISSELLAKLESSDLPENKKAFFRNKINEVVGNNSSLADPENWNVDSGYNLILASPSGSKNTADTAKTMKQFSDSSINTGLHLDDALYSNNYLGEDSPTFNADREAIYSSALSTTKTAIQSIDLTSRPEYATALNPTNIANQALALSTRGNELMGMITSGVPEKGITRFHSSEAVLTALSKEYDEEKIDDIINNGNTAQRYSAYDLQVETAKNILRASNKSLSADNIKNTVKNLSGMLTSIREYSSDKFLVGNLKQDALIPLSIAYTAVRNNTLATETDNVTEFKNIKKSSIEKTLTVFNELYHDKSVNRDVAINEGWKVQEHFNNSRTINYILNNMENLKVSDLQGLGEYFQQTGSKLPPEVFSQMSLKDLINVNISNYLNKKSTLGEKFDPDDYRKNIETITSKVIMDLLQHVKGINKVTKETSFYSKGINLSKYSSNLIGLD